MIEAADEATDDALKAEGLLNSFAAVHESFNGPSRHFKISRYRAIADLRRESFGRE
jgi:hypothetical protein